MFSGLIAKSCNSASSTTEHCSYKIMRTLTKSANNREEFRGGIQTSVCSSERDNFGWRDSRMGENWPTTINTWSFFFFPFLFICFAKPLLLKVSFFLLTGYSSFQTTADMPAIFHSHFSNWWWHESRVINDRSIGKSWPFPLFAYNILSHSKLPLLGRHEILRKKNVNDSIIVVWTVNEF